MLTAVLVIAAAFAGWWFADGWLARRRDRDQQRAGGWSRGGPNRSFHSTGWEDTVPPLEARDPQAEPRPVERRKGFTA